MKWEQLVKGQAKDYKSFLPVTNNRWINSTRISYCCSASIRKRQRRNVRDKIARDREAWEILWGINGQKIVAIRAIHQKELDAFFANPE